MIRIAHLSDLHIGPLPVPTWRQLATKRITGYINWQRNRHKGPRQATLAAILADIAAHAPDHICISGDMMNLTLPDEFPNALRLLQAIGAPDRVSIVPGNHDAYVPGALAKLIKLWQPFLTSDDGSIGYPLLRIRKHVAIIGLSTGEATLPFRATGSLGVQQCERLSTLLNATKAQGLTRLIMLHHPPVKGLVPGYKRLTDQAEFRSIIRTHGAELILHGHSHQSTLTELEAPSRPCPVVGVSSASQSFGSKTHDPAAWNEVLVARSGAIRVIHHEVTGAEDPIRLEGRVVLETTEPGAEWR